jgi:hypothetical protein
MSKENIKNEIECAYRDINENNVLINRIANKLGISAYPYNKKQEIKALDERFNGIASELEKKIDKHNGNLEKRIKFLKTSLKGIE